MTELANRRLNNSRGRRRSGGVNARDGEAFNISRRLRELRLEHGLSLEELANRTSLTKGFLSLIERGLKAPSISTLLRLSEAYALPMGALLDGSRGSEATYSVVRRTDRKRYAREGSLYGYRYEAIAFPRKRKRMEPFVVSPPLRTPRKFFTHKGEEMVYVLEGRIELHLGAEKVRLGTGDCAYFDAATPHRSHSIGARRALTLVVVTAKV